MFELRQYQIDLIESLRNSYRQGNKCPCLILPCGGGKSILLAHVVKNAIDKGGFVIVVVHRIELCNQLNETFKNHGINMSKCIIGMVQSMKKKIETFETPTMIITDEGHHGICNTYKFIYDCFPNAYRLTVTATPVRLNGNGLGEVCDDLIIGVTAKWLIDNRYLSPYKYYSIPVAEFNNLKTTRGDYDSKQLSNIMENNVIYGDTVRNYKRIADGKKTIVYCASVQSAYDTAKEFQLHGYSAVALDGKSKKDYRTQAINDFRNGEIQILLNNELFGEGLDIPDVECVILLRKTKSLTLFIQQSMRCMRMNPNNPDKIATIIDHVGNCFEHSLPDTERQWTLDSKSKRPENTVKIKTCPDCFAVIEQNLFKCPYCEHDFTIEVKGRLEKERVEAELEEIKEQEIDRLKNMKLKEAEKFRTWDEIEAFRKAKNYHIMWAIRFAKKKHINIPPKYYKLEGMVR